MNEQTKENIVKIGVIIAVAGIAVLLFLALMQIKIPSIEKINSNWLNPQGPEFVNETTEETCDDQCLYQKAIGDVSYCEQIKNETLKALCYNRWAEESLDYCLKASGETREECIYYHAQRMGDIEICKYASNRTACMIFFDECYKYDNETERGRCFAYEKNDYNYCKDDMCYFDFAMFRKDTSICEKISLPARRTACKSIIEKTDHCKELGVKAERDLCWQIFAIESKDSATCFKITKESDYALECFSYYAAVKHDLSFCDAGGFSLDDLWKCYTNYSLNSGDLAGCDAIYNKSLDYATTNIYNCYASYAKKYGDPSACNGIRDLAQMRTCYEGSILGAKNIDYTKCGRVQVEKWKNKCYTEYAKYNNDSSVCEYITSNENEKEMCYDAWKVYNNITGS